ncbi:MAG: M10 family metallopeptidase domain-containing protein, partial [Nitrospira sp.]|nr:M10 family metallopeptidase domain-containing protein [Nitrospira sp.]
TLVRTISVGDDAPEGLRGMDVTADGRRLYAAAPVKGGAAQFSTQQYPDGKIVIIDIDTRAQAQTLWTVIADQTVSQEPYFVKASETDPRLVTFTNRRSDPKGFGVIKATNEAHTSLDITYASLQLGSRLDNFDVNDASAIALLPAGTLPGQTKDYAFVTGWNRIQQDIPSRDPYIVERQTIEEQQAAGLVLGAPVGGNIGVIEDPFGTPKLIAATAGEFLSMPDGLTISPDGKTLYAAFSAQNAVRVFDVQKMFVQITKPENLVPLYSRKDSPPNFTRLEVSPLAGPSGLGINQPLDASIELAPIGTGRFPQGLAIAEHQVKVDVGFGRSNALQVSGSGGIFVTAEDGDTTPVIRWKATYHDQPLPDGWTTKLYLSVFKEGKGLFPADFGARDDGSTPEKDLGLHRILNGVEGVHHAPLLPEYREFDMNSVKDRALTLGQTYYVGIKVFDAFGNERGDGTAVAKFKLEQAPATTPFSSVTVLTHGFETRLFVNQKQPPEPFFEMARDIADAGGGGTVAAYDKSTGEWIWAGESRRTTLAEKPPASGSPLVLITDWMRESDISEEGFSEAAADSIFASLVRLDNDLKVNSSDSIGPVLSSPLHFLGHSRGTVVNSEIVQRIGNYFPSINTIRMTALDPRDFDQPSQLFSNQTGWAWLVEKYSRVQQLLTHPLDSITAFLSNPGSWAPSDIHYDDLFDPNVQRWANVAFADNYYQELGSPPFTITPNGRRLENFDINIGLSGDDELMLPARAGFTEGQWGDYSHVFGTLIPEIGGPHSRVWRWYAGTIDLGLTQFDTKSDREPIYRSLADKDLTTPKFTVSIPLTGQTVTLLDVKFPFGGLDIPWYVAHEYPRLGHSTFNYSDPNAVWEGIGEGWAFSPLGGVQFQDFILPATQRVAVTTDNTDTLVKAIVNPDGVAIESLFNGNFEHGTVRLGERFPLYEKDAPGWAFHNGQAPGSRPINLQHYQVPFQIRENYVAELNTGFDSELVHNRFYIDPQAIAVQFNYYVKDVEKGTGEVIRQPSLNVILRVDGQEHVLERLSPELDLTTTRDPSGDPDTDPAASFVIPQALRGQTGELIFRLSVPASQPAYVSGKAKVWLDNVTVLSTQALATETPVQALVEQPVASASDSLESLTEAARLWWTGSVQLPDGIIGLSLGSLGTPATHFIGSCPGSNGGDQNDLWNTGFREGGFNDEGFLADPEAILRQWAGGIGIDFAGSTANQQRVLNGKSSAPADCHSIQTHDDSSLANGQHSPFTPLVSSIVNESVPCESNIVENIPLVDHCAIEISNFDNGVNSSTPDGEGTVSNLEINDIEGLTLVPLPELSIFTGECTNFEITNPLLHFGEQGTGGQGNTNCDHEQLFQHSPSFGTPTLPPDRKSVNGVDENGHWPALSFIEGSSAPNVSALSTQSSALSAEQLDLLSRATINIADLADGYLALTLGTTITLDTDAAGYGWFIDPTPFTHEEFVSLSAWELEAAPGSGAENKIDLMTVLMHELGHVMGLGHVSSAVDGTRLMAGAIDPGIRRLPSALDLGPEPSSDPNHSVLSPQSSRLDVWAPYMAHYTTTQ